MAGNGSVTSRRGLLRAGAGLIGSGLIGSGLIGSGVLAGLAGCRWTDPVVHSTRNPSGTTPTPEPTPEPSNVAAGEDETTLASHLAWLAAAPSGVSAAVKQWATTVMGAHAGAAHLLGQLDPMAVPVSSPAPVKAAQHATPQAALAAIKADSARLVGEHRTRSATAEEPGMALLWASLMVTAASQGVPTRPMLARATRPHHIDPGTPTEARSVLLQRLHAVVQGYETGVAVIAFTDRLRKPAEDRLAALGRLRDTVATGIREDGDDPPGPRPGYRQPITPTTVTQATQLFVLLERDLLDAWGRVVAATEGTDRDEALAAMLAQVPRCQAFGGAMVVWPGWP
ncbi:DUF4439 domain-containing protein [Aestuariimicrobium ganziense]|uniref:DUF4439 domain-containing protein n=1 Tax=Aestuariimicrobium ganziense TaxID=2773677 RepID=UPI0019415741|nr:DUF4439 domain-containing protein [Aestuariimicrobium ganziense]